jgi:hypothetical protein
MEGVYNHGRSKKKNTIMADQRKKIQSCLKRLRECDDIIHEATNAKKLKNKLTKELNSLEIDLIKEKKIERVNMSFKEWLEETNYQHFYVYRCQGEYEYIVWKGEDNLNTYESEHFNHFIKDYLATNQPDYSLYELSETQHGFEDGDLSYTIHDRSHY